MCKKLKPPRPGNIVLHNYKMSRYNLRTRKTPVATAKKMKVVQAPNHLPPRTWNTLVAAAAIIENKMPYEVAHDVKHLYTVLKSLASFKLVVESCEHLWQYRVAMINQEKTLIEMHLPHIYEHSWYYTVIDMFRNQNYTAILSCLYNIIAAHEDVSNLEDLIDAVSITSSDAMEED